MPERIQDLRELMVIHKARNPNPVISTQSLLLFAVTWSLWFFTVYLIVNDHKALFYNHIVGSWTLADMLKGALLFVLVQLNLLFGWSVWISRQNARD